jgi:hypothetical protein
MLVSNYLPKIANNRLHSVAHKMIHPSQLSFMQGMTQRPDHKELIMSPYSHVERKTKEV